MTIRIHIEIFHAVFMDPSSTRTLHPVLPIVTVQCEAEHAFSAEFSPGIVSAEVDSLDKDGAMDNTTRKSILQR